MINLNEVLTTLDGQPLKADDKDLTVRSALALIVITEQRSPDPLRAYLLAKKLTDDKDVKLDQAEEDYLKNAVKKTEIYNTLVTGQLLAKFA